jgi:cytidylate kinase
MRERKYIVKDNVYHKLKNKINSTKARDEIIIDTSRYSIEEVVRIIEKYLRNHAI